MKKLLTFVAAILISISANAQFGPSLVSINSVDQLPFIASLDNSTPTTPSNQINFTQINPGNHYLEVYRLYNNVYGIAPYVQVIFKGFIQVPSNAQIAYVINQAHQLVMVQSAPIVVYPPIQQPIRQLPILYPNRNPIRPHLVNNPYAGFVGMHPQNFQQLLATINATSFDSSKRNIAKQGIASNAVSAQQVLEIIRLFSFESSKLEIAKFAYAYTVDKNNYYIVNNGFSFSSSIDQLNRAIGYQL